MLNIVWSEIGKLKRSKMVILSMLGVLATPVMLVVEALQQHFEHPDQIPTLDAAYRNSILYVMILVNLMIYVAITAYLFSREYTENTWKTILPIPLSRSGILAGKFITLLLWVLLLTLITWVGILLVFAIYHATIGMAGFEAVVALKWLVKFVIGNVIVWLMMTPFAYIAEKSKGLVEPMIVSAVIVLGNAALSNQKLGALYPWTAAYLIVADRIKETGYSVCVVAAIIVLTVLAGAVATWIHFKREDIR